jgi:hypothetical protein
MSTHFYRWEGTDAKNVRFLEERENCLAIYINCLAIYINCLAIYINCLAIYINCLAIYIVFPPISIVLPSLSIHVALLHRIFCLTLPCLYH